MKIQNKEWFTLDDKTTHYCGGKPILDFSGKEILDTSSPMRKWFYPVEDGKCIACEKEYPDDVE